MVPAILQLSSLHQVTVKRPENPSRQIAVRNIFLSKGTFGERNSEVVTQSLL
jgi:hypothetical protein